MSLFAVLSLMTLKHFVAARDFPNHLVILVSSQFWSVYGKEGGRNTTMYSHYSTISLFCLLPKFAKLNHVPAQTCFA